MVTAKASIRAALGDTVILVTKEKTIIVSCCLIKKRPTKSYTPDNSNRCCNMLDAPQRSQKATVTSHCKGMKYK